MVLVGEAQFVDREGNIYMHGRLVGNDGKGLASGRRGDSKPLAHPSNLRQACPVADEPLVCVECGKQAPPDARGWRSFLTVDDQVAHYCAECAEREFGTA